MSKNKPFKENFLLQVFAAVIVSAGITGGFFSTDVEIFRAAVAGISLSLFNALAGYAAIEFSFNKSYTQFIQIVLGGVLFRLLLMASALLLLIMVFKVHIIALVVSLFGMYVVFLSMEVFYIYAKWQKKISA